MVKTQVWDTVLVNKYLGDLRVAKKLGRKERKHKEAQAVLAAAAASSRISSLRKDLLDGSANRENLGKLNSTSGRPGYCSQLMPRAREIVPKVGVRKDSLERHSGSIQSALDFSKDHPKSCDIYSRPETLMNPILVCSSCKVSVHMDCYRSVRESTGPWYCELCEELRSSGAPAVDFLEKFTSAAECALCGGNTGAFRKCKYGKWVHAFCAEYAS
ncbi:protein Jade-3-like [Eucalyptus grandis]|uniref:protein Jade-3-like n=1 Tax=Eucalyptus grandis TaxID=71139 RepID=UPI00192F05AF|nr:protein Jade-3-like [Eucalyptus grandis]XP_039166297.1 protein Jade-3-like [Eucalyptus grandis]